MKNIILSFLRLLVAAILFWSFAFCLFILIRYFAIGSEEGIEVTDYSITQILPFGILLGVLIGTLYAVIEFLFDKLLSKNLSLALVLLQKTIIYLIGMVLSLTYVYKKVEVSSLELSLDNSKGWWMEDKVFWLTIGYFLICSIIFSFIKIANERFGKGVLFNQLIGKYKKPREERRIFMFLDLQGSTTIAEQLGHYKYSELIQECFYDLNRVIGDYKAEIYQYVGDEAVISWKFDKGIERNNCVELFYKFQNRLEKKTKYYQKHFGVQPKFKAGLHGGKLIVTEVGTVKKEIAYHGDVINTSARIQGECNTYNKSLLISERLLDKLKLHKYKLESIGNISLKGKEQEVKLFSINKK